jgi:uncharacterized membrane protein
MLPDLPDPLHPAVVHLPIALALLVPLLAFAALIAARAGWLPARAWAFVVLLQACLVGSAYVAIETGEDEEERVERVVAERHIEDHEERAERLLWGAGIVLLVGAAGLAPGRVGSLARPLGFALSLGVLALAVDVGHSGGELVYRHGAASAYTSDASAPPRE